MHTAEGLTEKQYAVLSLFEPSQYYESRRLFNLNAARYGDSLQVRTISSALDALTAKQLLVFVGKFGQYGAKTYRLAGPPPSYLDAGRAFRQVVHKQLLDLPQPLFAGNAAR